MDGTTTPGTVELIDPNTLTIERNVRTEAALEKGFIDSIRANGVIQPIVAWRAEDGTVTVRYGQRRTLAAREAGIATVPVYITHPDRADDAQRIVEQLVENEQRAELTDLDRTEAWKALELEGLSITAIAKRTGTKRDRIKTGLTVADSQTGSALMVEFGLTLDQAAVLIEFEDDQEASAALTQIALEDPAYFAVAVERERQDRTREVARAVVQEAEAAKGHTILTERPGYNETPYRLHHLRTAEGTEPTAEDVQGKPGVCVYVEVYRPDDARPIYYVTDPAALGYTATADASSTGPTSGPMTDEQKAERKVLIANNKEWDAAEVVRREWLATLLSRKTLPKGAAHIVAITLTAARSLVAMTMSHGNSLAASVLGIEGTGHDLAEYAGNHPTRAQHVALAVALCGVEDTTSRETWRYPRDTTAAYFRTLETWGYTLTPVERIAAKHDDQ